MGLEWDFNWREGLYSDNQVEGRNESGPSSNTTGVLMEETIWINTHIRRTPREHKGRDPGMCV